MAYEKCSDVSEEIWHDFEGCEPREIDRSHRGSLSGGDLSSAVSGPEVAASPGPAAGAGGRGAGGGAGVPGLPVGPHYLLHLDPALLGPWISPLELPGGATFFRGHHGLPSAPGGPVRPGSGRFLAAGQKLTAETRPAGDAAVALEAFPGLVVEVILWRADDEFPAQVSFTLPAHLDRFWFLDAVWGLLNLVTQELILAAAGESS